MDTAQASIAYSTSAYLFYENPNWGTNNNNGTVQSITVQAGGPAPLSSLPSFTAQYSYDRLNRVSQVVEGANDSRVFNYDQYGNLWVSGATGIAAAGPTSNVYNAAKNQIGGMGYDNAGNITGNGATSYTYDAENRQTSATDAPGIGGGTVNYLFDGSGQRVEKVFSSGASTVYVYDAFGQLAAEYSTAQNTSPCATCYLTWDHLGTARVVTDQNGTVMARHDYLPFGEEIPAGYAGRSAPFGNTDYVNPKFTGQMRDQETGLDFFNARYFGPALGRFTSPDPANAGADLTNPQSWNGYSYVRNNPLNSADPSGLVMC
jgi:RHS repeat-associated protein